jgi:phosphopantothenoylcysteine decarboxylase/phosphopantothenate--cysteine ligase
MLTRLLTRGGHDVNVVMTEAATRFVTPLTLATLTGNPVSSDMWKDPHSPAVEHIALAEHADAAVVAPATANIIGKLASGIADDMLSTVFTAVTCPVLVCPSMNVNMFRNRIVQANLERLTAAGYQIMQPEAGWLACGWTGQGRMPEPDAIAWEIERMITPADLRGERILVTAGRTEEPLDPIRFLTNRSSGKMGTAVARRAALRGADVTLVAGPMSVGPPNGVKHIPVRTASEMHAGVMELFPDATVVIKAAAVADFRPAQEQAEKIKKEDAALTIDLVKNIDILHALGQQKSREQILVGFAAETRDVLANGRKKMKEKNLDLLALNDVSQVGAGFDYDTNIVRFLHRSGKEEQMEIMPKDKVADLILDRVKAIRLGLV